MRGETSSEPNQTSPDAFSLQWFSGFTNRCDWAGFSNRWFQSESCYVQRSGCKWTLFSFKQTWPPPITPSSNWPGADAGSEVLPRAETRTSAGSPWRTDRSWRLQLLDWDSVRSRAGQTGRSDLNKLFNAGVQRPLVVTSGPARGPRSLSERLGTKRKLKCIHVKTGLSCRGSFWTLKV